MPMGARRDDRERAAIRVPFWVVRVCFECVRPSNRSIMSDGSSGAMTDTVPQSGGLNYEALSYVPYDQH
jgi:hypothetical protein